MTEGESTAHDIFSEQGRRYQNLDRIVTLGPFYPQTAASGVQGQLREMRTAYGAPDRRTSALQEGLEWTQTINAFNRGRRWALRRLLERLDPLLEAGIAVAIVPSHAAFVIDTPLRELARLLAASQDRVDATECLERHQTIARILYGGPSSRSLHRQTIRVAHAETILEQRVLLLDDIAKSGASLMTCRELLREAGASVVQALALARVTVPTSDPS